MTTAAYRGERGPDCTARRSQSIRSPSRDHGAASEPSPAPTLRPVTACQPPTEIKERGLKNHQLNERLHIQTGSNELMDTTQIKETRDLKQKKRSNHHHQKRKINMGNLKKQQQKEKPVCRWGKNKNAEENNSMADHQKAPES